MEILNLISIAPKFITDNIVSILTSYGFNVTSRWVSTLFIGVCLLLFYITTKITKPIVKWGLILISILLLSGLLIPNW